MEKTRPFFSVISPVYGCRSCLQELCERIIRSVSQITDDFEIILVNDSSPDNAWESIAWLASKDSRIKGIDLSRNFGQHYAITAGLHHCTGEWIVVMDCDLQDRPEEIFNLYRKAQEGYDIVLARRVHRRDNFIKKAFSRMFYRLLGYLTETRQDSAIANFGVYNRKVIDSVLSMGDSLRYFPTMIRWVGYRLSKIDVVHSEREEGKTSYTLKKLIKLALDIIIAFSDKPLRLTVKFGISISIISFLVGLVYLFMYFTGEVKVLGYSSLIISIWFLSGIIIFVLGIIGLYLGKTFETVKKRPSFIVRDKINLNS